MSERALDAKTIEAVLTEVQSAKARGWDQDALRRWFGKESVDAATYKAALAGQPVSQSAAALFAQVSITGMPSRPYEPNRADIKKHIDWLTEPARGDFDDALLEICHDGNGRGITGAKLFGLDELDAAVDFAARKNLEGRNVYVGAALRLPDTDRNKRCSASDFYVATAVPIDIDQDYDATRARMAEVCDDGLVVVTGMVPARRSHHWTRLVEPCDDETEFGHAFAALVMNAGADMKVKDPARVMRLGGTVAYPSPDKLANGYLVEVTSTTVKTDARPTSIDRLKALEPSLVQVGGFASRPAGGGGEIERHWTGRVENGRESHFRDLLLMHLRWFHEENDRDPTDKELFAAAYVDFDDPIKVNNDDQRWTCPAGQQQLLHRAQNTLRRMKQGRLAKFGIYSRETESNKDEAIQAQANRKVTRAVPFVDPEPVRLATETAAYAFQPRGFTGEIPSPRPWAYGNFLMYGAVSGVASPPGVGKTTFSVQIGIAFGMGMTFGPWGPVPGGGGKVWLYNGEEPQDELDRRFMAATAEMGVEDHVAAERFSYNSGLDEKLQFVRIDPHTKEIQRHPSVDAIKAIIKAQGFKLFIVDPLIEFNGATEDGEGLKAVGSVLREIANDCQCSVLFFHHTPKASTSDTAAGDMNAMRGGGPLIGSARFVSTMFSMTTKDAEDYDVPKKDRHQYVRFDDAKANMAVMSGEPQWWVKLGVCIGNGDSVRPADNIGVLRPVTLKSESGGDTMAQTLARAQALQTDLDRVAAEMVRVCSRNGNTSPEKAESFDRLIQSLDLVKTGMSVTKTKALVIGEFGTERILGGQRVVISTIPRGSLTVRKVHIETVSED